MMEIVLASLFGFLVSTLFMTLIARSLGSFQTFLEDWIDLMVITFLLISMLTVGIGTIFFVIIKLSGGM